MAGKKGRSGRRPQSKGWKLLAGSRGGAEAASVPASPAQSLPVPDGQIVCPAWLDAAAQEEWHRIAPILATLNLLTSIDRAAFAAYCDAWSRFRWSVEAMRRRPRIARTPNGMQQINPLITARRQAIEDLYRAADRFGMTPHARQQVADVILGGRFSHPTPPAAEASGEPLGPRPVTDRLGSPC
jgi:P27 family predicted phage terminase small subunit